MGESGKYHTRQQGRQAGDTQGFDDSRGQQAPLHAANWHGPGKQSACQDNSFVLLDFDELATPTLTVAQWLAGGSLLTALLVLLWVHTATTILAVSILFSFFYITVSVFRAAVLAGIDRTQSDLRAGRVHSVQADLPSGDYIILVPLYREASQVADLVASLENLQWETGQKHVYLLLEHDDVETAVAVTAILPRPGFDMIIVPPGSPRTKPRALNYALRRVQGDYLVIYDAEDRPHPLQLVEAATVFMRSSGDLVCLQAPLTVDNPHESWLASLFAMEYDTLFYGILPTLARWQAPVPLGGTSNHFVFRKLLDAGGWDSFNVAEDADLGMRLARRRLRCGTIISPTMEEAPARLHPWMMQRTRWVKGWIQTLLVHLRSPARTAKEMGLRNFALFHVILVSLVVSVLVHPLFLAAYVFQMARFFSGIPLATVDIAMAGISSFNLVAGYTTYCLLVGAVELILVRRSGRSIFLIFQILLFPVYWLLISVAGWRAVIQLVFKPHIWEKTEHGNSQRRKPDWISTATGFEKQR